MLTKLHAEEQRGIGTTGRKGDDVGQLWLRRMCVGFQLQKAFSFSLWFTPSLFAVFWWGATLKITLSFSTHDCPVWHTLQKPHWKANSAKTKLTGRKTKQPTIRFHWPSKPDIPGITRLIRDAVRQIEITAEKEGSQSEEGRRARGQCVFHLACSAACTSSTKAIISS